MTDYGPSALSVSPISYSRGTGFDIVDSAMNSAQSCILRFLRWCLDTVGRDYSVRLLSLGSSNGIMFAFSLVVALVFMITT